MLQKLFDKLVQTYWRSMSQALCEQRHGPPPPPPTKASEGGVIVHPAITKDPELLMVAAMIDPSWKFTMVENEFQRTVKIAEWLFRDEKLFFDNHKGQ